MYIPLSLSLYIYIYMYTDAYMYIYIYIYIHIQLYIYIYIYIYPLDVLLTHDGTLPAARIETAAPRRGANSARSPLPGPGHIYYQ